MIYKQYPKVLVAVRYNSLDLNLIVADIPKSELLDLRLPGLHTVPHQGSVSRSYWNFVASNGRTRRRADWRISPRDPRPVAVQHRRLKLNKHTGNKTRL